MGMKVIPEAISENCLTVGEVIKELSSHDPDALAFLLCQRRFYPIATADAYHAEELIVLRLSEETVYLKNIEHEDFANTEETIVVLGTEL